MKAKILTPLPGKKSEKVISKLKNLNGGYSSPYPFVYSGNGKGPYFKDLDGNTFLDMACNVASTPLGYNHPKLNRILKKYSKTTPVRYAGQDFNIKEHADMIESLTSTTKDMNTAFLTNSGAEAVENSIKIAMRYKPTSKYGIAFTGAFHGRTLGALSLTDSKEVQKRDFFSIPTKRLPYSNAASKELLRIFEEESDPREIAFVIIEHIQGEGGYHAAPKQMVKEIRKICKKNDIAYIADEVQSGVGRTGEWWAFEHYGISPDIFSSAKALQVGATVSKKKYFPKEEGSISSTWGGGHTLDLAMGLETIRTIRKDRLLQKNRLHGRYIQKWMKELETKIDGFWEPRGIGLMAAFDLPTSKIRDNVVIECLKNGLVLLGCGKKGIRIIPPYTIEKAEIDEGFNILANSVVKCLKPKFKHTGKICNFLKCSEQIS